MNSFEWSRFLHAFRNDLQQQWRKLWITSLGFVGFALIIYLTNVDPRQVDEPEIFIALFPLALIGGGLIFTSTIFADMHHPLQRFHYLTLPYSNLERFISRYLMTGPLFYLYVLVVYFVFDTVAGGISGMLMNHRADVFAPFRQEVVYMTLSYFFLHGVMLTGAIYYRSYHLIKTALAGALFTIGAVFVQILTFKLVFFDYFSSLFSFKESVPAESLLADNLEIQLGLMVLLYLWVLYMAYRCLCEHEVQDEL